MDPNRRITLATVLSICVVFQADALARAETQDDRRILFSGEARTEILQVVRGARARLASSACQRVLRDFVDERGRTLDAALTDSGRTVLEHFDLLYVVEGNVTAQCLGGKRSAFTAPHSRVVFICGQVLQRVADQDQASAEILLIHELLHTLGLGENPPSSSQITDRVAQRCRG